MNVQRASANDTVRQTTYPNVTLTRDQLQTEALIIEKMLDAAIASFGGADAEENLFSLVERAHDRAHKLNIALDSVNAPEGQS
ncbi:hypothetical protein [Ruegeria jejuensis]|uniref:hypothetical protein n=1 Tax=Ruegeria jejuensis TaxID=3233338 RepID=UPI00355B721B